MQRELLVTFGQIHTRPDVLRCLWMVLLSFLYELSVDLTEIHPDLLRVLLVIPLSVKLIMQSLQDSRVFEGLVNEVVFQ